MTPIGRVLLSCGFAAVAAAAEVRDPFVPPPPAGARTALQRLDVGQLRLVALVHAPAPRALLQDETGIGYVATVGTAIGPHGGTVAAIERRSLRIREPDAATDVVLSLPAAPEVAP